MEDQDQLLKDFVASAQKYGYDYDVIMPKFPEFEGYDVEMLKGYVSKVEEINQGSDVYDYTEANSAFPDLFPQKKKDQTEGAAPLAPVSEVASSESTAVSGMPSGGSDSPATRTRVTPEGYSFEELSSEKPFIEGSIGDFVRSIPWIGNDIDDWARAWSTGAQARGQAAPAMDMLIPTYGEMTGEDFNKEDYREAAEALAAEVRRYENFREENGISDELMAWNKSIQENGHGMYGLFKTIWEHKGDLRNIAGQWALESLSTQLNEEGIEKAAAVQAGGMLAGAPLGAAGVGAAGVATLPVSMATLSGVTAATQFLVDELKQRVGEDFNAEAILDALDDDTFRNTLRKDAGKYGLVIGFVDGVTFKAGAGVSREMGKALQGGWMPKTREFLAVGFTEAEGSMLGEAAASEAVGEPATAEALFQEGVGGAFATPITMTYRGIQDLHNRGIDNQNASVINQLNSRAVYTANGQRVQKQDLLDIVSVMTAEEFENANIEVKDDQATADLIQKRYEQIKKGEKVVPLPSKKPNKIQQAKDFFRRKVIDTLDPLVALQRSAQEARGERVSRETDMDAAFSMFSSRTANRMKNVINVAQSMGKALKDAGLDPATARKGLDRFLYARHAPERNRVMTQRYKDRIKQIQDEAKDEKRNITPAEEKEIKTLEGYIEENRGSGMSDADAQAYMDGLTPEERAGYEAAAKFHDEVVADTRKTLREAGLESEETVDLFESQYEFYTPLRGFAELDPEKALKQADLSAPNAFDVRGSGIVRAEGRITEASDMSTAALNQNAMTHMRAEKNKVGRTVYDFANANPNEEVYSTMDQEQFGKLKPSQKKRAVGVRIDGETKYVVFGEKYAQHAALLQDFSPRKMGAFMKFFSAANRVRSKTFTSLNPEFFMTNFVRDIQAGFANLAADADLTTKEGRELVAKTMKESTKNLRYMLASMVPSVRESLKAKDPEYFKFLQEFEEDGGVTGWGYAPNIEALAKELDQAADSEKGKRGLAWMGKNGLEMLTTMSDAFENSIRLSTYVNARKMGIARDRAAFMSKEVTVNFNRSGEWGTALNSTYMFFNASMQSSKRLVKTMNSKSGRAVGTGMALTGAMITEYNRSVSGEDEDGVLFYDKISPYERARNIIIMRSNGKDYVKIPLAYGYGLFHNVGEQVSSVSRGGRTAGEATFEMADATLSAFSPVTFGSSDNALIKAGKTFTPSLAMPIADLMVNEDWRGNRIYFDFEGKADSEQGFDSPEFAKDFFQGLNKMTGGTEIAGGDEFYSIDINPDILTYALESYAGGIGQAAVKTGETVASVIEGEVPDIGRFPVLSKFYSKENYAQLTDYFDYADNLEIAEKRVKEFKNDEIRERFKGEGRFRGIGVLETTMKKSKKGIKDLEEQLDKAYASENTKEIERLEGLINRNMKMFNKAFRQYVAKTEQ
tara:strand:- start:15983 stop:20257 length:4275 start_codon:yes stop_codon:yes gene_type:complete